MQAAVKYLSGEYILKFRYSFTKLLLIDLAQKIYLFDGYFMSDKNGKKHHYEQLSGHC